MTLRIERVANGYIIRDDSEPDTYVVSEDNEIAVAWANLAEDGSSGLAGLSEDVERLRAILSPGDKPLPERPERCRHPSVERRDLVSEPPRWSCPCGAQFGLMSDGNPSQAERGATASPSKLATVSGKEMTPADVADWHMRGWKADELGSVYAVNGGRYVVSLIVTYNDSKRTDRLAGIENIHSPATAASAALDLTRDSGSRSTIWHVFDRLTQQMHLLAQGEFERA